MLFIRVGRKSLDGILGVWLRPLQRRDFEENHGNGYQRPMPGKTRVAYVADWTDRVGPAPSGPPAMLHLYRRGHLCPRARLEELFRRSTFKATLLGRVESH